MLTRAINSIKVGRRYRKDMGDVALLAESVHQVGKLHPVVIDSHDRLIAGRRRLAAAKQLAWNELAVMISQILLAVGLHYRYNVGKQ